MSDTPETDYAIHGVWYRGDHGSAFVDHARKLERDMDEAMRMLVALRDSVRAHLTPNHAKRLSVALSMSLAFDNADALLARMSMEKKIRDGMKR